MVISIQLFFRGRGKNGGENCGEHVVKSLEQSVELIRENNIAKINIFLNQKLGDGWEKSDKKLGENQIKIIALILTDNKITTKKLLNSLK